MAITIQQNYGQVVETNSGTMNNYAGSNVKQQKEKKEISEEELTRVIENNQKYFWGNSSYAVLFCLLRDECGMPDNQTKFESIIGLLKFKSETTRPCPPGTIANAFSNNPIYKLPVDKWGNQIDNRQKELLDALRKDLKL